MYFTDVQFQPGFHNESDLTDRSVWVETSLLHSLHCYDNYIVRVQHKLNNNVYSDKNVP